MWKKKHHKSLNGMQLERNCISESFGRPGEKLIVKMKRNFEHFDWVWKKNVKVLMECGGMYYNESEWSFEGL